MVTQKLYKNKVKNGKNNNRKKKYVYMKLIAKEIKKNFSFISVAPFLVKRCVIRSNDWDFGRCLYCHANVKRTV